MPKANNSDSKISELLTRGVAEVLVRENLEKRLKGREKLRIKLGIDPTGPNIHLGRAIPLWKLRDFQDLGHRVVIIIGDFTAQIGDPSDKLSKRPFLSAEQIKNNLKTYKVQLGKILDLSKVEWRNNSEWLKKLSFFEATQLAESFSVQQMLARRNFKERLERQDDISVRELMYPLMQGYDSVATQADVELGGFDQLFNLLAGRKIQQYYGKKQQDILATEMLEGTDGRKMSTSWGNVVNITEQPNEMYGKLMSLKDELIPKYLLLVSRLPIEEVNKLSSELNSGANPKEIKSVLAKAVVNLYHGAKAAEQAEFEFDNVHKQGKLPEQVPSAVLPQGVKTMLLVELLVFTKLATSKSEARRLIEQGGVKIDGEQMKNWQDKIILKPGMVLQVGSRKFIRLS